jgi:hypothetical protein
MSSVEMKTPEDLKPGKEGDRFVTIQPAKKNRYIGIVSKDEQITPVTIGGTWYPKRPVPRTVTDVILHFHGGRFQQNAKLSRGIKLMLSLRSLCDWRWTSGRLWLCSQEFVRAHLCDSCSLPTIPPCFKSRRAISSTAAGCDNFTSVLDRRDASTGRQDHHLR